MTSHSISMEIDQNQNKTLQTLQTLVPAVTSTKTNYYKEPRDEHVVAFINDPSDSFGKILILDENSNNNSSGDIGYQHLEGSLTNNRKMYGSVRWEYNLVNFNNLSYYLAVGKKFINDDSSAQEYETEFKNFYSDVFPRAKYFNCEDLIQGMTRLSNVKINFDNNDNPSLNNKYLEFLSVLSPNYHIAPQDLPNSADAYFDHWFNRWRKEIMKGVNDETNDAPRESRIAMYCNTKTDFGKNMDIDMKNQSFKNLNQKERERFSNTVLAYKLFSQIQAVIHYNPIYSGPPEDGQKVTLGYQKTPIGEFTYSNSDCSGRDLISITRDRDQLYVTIGVESRDEFNRPKSFYLVGTNGSLKDMFNVVRQTRNVWT